MDIEIGNLGSREIPKKSWGWEEWIVNNNLYCGKKLHFTHDGGSTSMHYHRDKHETMYVECGVFEITIIDTSTANRRTFKLGHGQSIVIPQNTPHRIRCMNVDYSRAEALILEFSTHHRDGDSYRIEL